MKTDVLTLSGSASDRLADCVVVLGEGKSHDHVMQPLLQRGTAWIDYKEYGWTTAHSSRSHERYSGGVRGKLVWPMVSPGKMQTDGRPGELRY
jgi:hypothetical protein